MKIITILLATTILTFNVFGNFNEISSEVIKWSQKEHSKLKTQPFSFIKIETKSKAKQIDYQAFMGILKPDTKLCSEESQKIFNEKLGFAVNYYPAITELNYFCYESDKPGLAFFGKSLLVVSSKSLELLKDTEFVALIGHELAHSFFVKEFETAALKKDDNLLKVIELKCDLIAIALLKSKNISIDNYLSGLKKHTDILDKLSDNENFTNERVNFINSVSLTF